MKRNIFLIVSLLYLGWWILELSNTVGTQTSGIVTTYSVMDVLGIGTFLASLYALGYLTGREQNNNN